MINRVYFFKWPSFLYLCFPWAFSSSTMFWGFNLRLRPPKYWDFWLLHIHSGPVIQLILSRLLERQGRRAVSQEDTLIFISHAADIWDEHLSEALRAAKTLIYSRNCFLRQVALLAKFSIKSWTIKAERRFWLPASLEHIVWPVFCVTPPTPQQQQLKFPDGMSICCMFRAFIVHNINNYYTNTTWKNYFKSSLSSVPTGKGN